MRLNEIFMFFSLLSKTVPCKIYLRLGILDLHEGKRMNTFSPILYVEGLDALIHSLHTSSCWLSIPLFHLGKVREWCVFFMLSPKKDFKRSTSIGKAFIEWTTFCRSNTQFEPFSNFSKFPSRCIVRPLALALRLRMIWTACYFL